MKRTLFLLFNTFLILLSTSVFAHGVIESPASREQFCGVESKPHEIYSPTMTHEKCRPIMTKSDGGLDNSIYNFMAVLTHTTGRQGRTHDNLPNHVCGFDAETWGGGKTPWDAAIDWPTNTLTAGANKFIWNISWGNHFGDTEEFAYWITKDSFVYDKGKELTWDDFEDEPFCLLNYDDANPSANPNIVADKINNKFITTCTVPARQNRAVIYAEWGRNHYTFERFHSCVDAVFSDDSTTPTEIHANISNLPDTITGATELSLDASGSQGSDLSYQWSISTNNHNNYSLYDSDKAIARLVISDTDAEQQVAINLSVHSSGFSDTTSKIFTHIPAINDVWMQIGSALQDDTLVAGDKVSLRIIDKDGKDSYLPATPITLDDQSSMPVNWSYQLAQAINGKNSFSVNIGVLNSTTNGIEPIVSATENKIYVPSQSNINNSYVVVEKKQANVTCKVSKKSGGNAYWMGYEIYSDDSPILLDFTDTGIDLNNLNIDQGVFSNVEVLSKYKLLINHKPNWVTMTTPGYIGFNASNYQPLTNDILAACQAG